MPFSVLYFTKPVEGSDSDFQISDSVNSNLPDLDFTRDHGIKSTARATKLSADLQKFVDNNEYIAYLSKELAQKRMDIEDLSAEEQDEVRQYLSNRSN